MAHQHRQVYRRRIVERAIETPVEPQLYRPAKYKSSVEKYDAQFGNGTVFHPKKEEYMHVKISSKPRDNSFHSLDDIDPNLLPRGHKDRKLSFEEIYGYSREEKARRDAADRLDPKNFQLTPMTRTSLKLTPVKGLDDKSGRRCLAEPAISVVDRYPKPLLDVKKFQEQDPPPLPSRPGSSASTISSTFISSALSEAQDKIDLTAASDAKSSEDAKKSLTTPLHELASSERLLNLTSLGGTLKRNPLAVAAKDAGHRTPLHWLVLNPKLTLSMLKLYMEQPGANEAISVVDAHGENTPIDYFMTAHKRIGHTKWRKCLLYLASHDIAGELIYDATPFYVESTKGCQGLSAAPLMEYGGRSVSVRCDAPPERQHLQGNPQALFNSLRKDVTTSHPDKVVGFELRQKGTPCSWR